MENFSVPLEGQGASGSQSPQNDQDAQLGKQARACETCRRLKIRCIVDDDSTNGACRKCIKARQRCVTHVPVSRQRKKNFKADTRVVELEKKMEALVSAFEATNKHSTSLQAKAGSSSSSDQQANVTNANISLSVMDDNGIMRVIDFVDQGLMDDATSYRLFDFWRNTLSSRCPLVIVPSSITAEDVRRQQPVLFMCTITAAASVLDPALNDRLVPQTRNILANRTICTGTPSLEVIKGLLVHSIYQTPFPGPGRQGDRNFNYLIHSAALMCMDLGLGKKVSAKSRRMFHDPTEQGNVRTNANTADLRRTWLAAYYGCSVVATILRRPLFLHWNSYTDECLEVIASAPDVQPTDKWLCHMIHAQHILEEAHNQFGMDEPMSQVAVTDWKTQNMLKYLTEKLNQWRSDVTPDMPQTEVELTYGNAMLYIHEIAMHQGHDEEDFRPPFELDPDKPEPELAAGKNTSAHISSLTICLRSIHQIFDALLKSDNEFIQTSPTPLFVRLLYAGTAFIKLGTLVCAPESPLASIFTKEDLKIEYYFDQIVTRLARASDDGKHSVIGIFARIIGMMRMWWLKISKRKASQKAGQTEVAKGKGPERTGMQWYMNAGMAIDPFVSRNSGNIPARLQAPMGGSSATSQQNVDTPPDSNSSGSFDLGMDLDWFNGDILSQLDNNMDWTEWDLNYSASMNPGRGP